MTKAAAARILFLDIAQRVGGAERVTELLCRGLPRHGLAARVATFYPAEPLPPEFTRSDLLVGPALASAPWALGAAPRLARLLRRARVDLLQVGPSPVTLAYGLLAVRLAGRRPALVAAVHTSDFSNDPPRRRLLRARLLGRADLVVALTERHREQLIREFRLQPERVAVVSNGVPPWDGAALPGGRSALGLPAGGLLIGIVGVLEPYKGHEFFLRAAALVRDRLPAARFLVVGDGPERRRLEDLTARLGLSACTTFLGYRGDVRAILPLLDLLVVSSVRIEALPLVAIEAMAAARPVVATRVGFVDKLVSDFVSGRLVPPREPSALAEAICWVLAKPDRPTTLGMAGQARFAARFTAERMVDDYAHTAWQLIQRRPR